MAVQEGRFVGRSSSFVAAGEFFAAAIVVGHIPYGEERAQAYVPAPQNQDPRLSQDQHYTDAVETDVH